MGEIDLRIEGLTSQTSAEDDPADTLPVRQAGSPITRVGCLRGSSSGAVLTGNGSRTVKVLPFPTPSLCAITVPPRKATSSLTIERPKPVPGLL
jgi:hypothetical protein